MLTVLHKEVRLKQRQLKSGFSSKPSTKNLASGTLIMKLHAQKKKINLENVIDYFFRSKLR